LYSSVSADNRPIFRLIPIFGYRPTDNRPVPYRCISILNDDFKQFMTLQKLHAETFVQMAKIPTNYR